MRFLILACLGTLGLSAAEPILTVEGLRVVKPVIVDEKLLAEGKVGDVEPQGFNEVCGTAISVRVRREQKDLRSFVEGESSLDIFCDDTGRNLLEGKPGLFAVTQRLRVLQVIGGTSALVDIHGHGLPAATASRFIVKGKLVFMVGGKEAETRAAITLTPGTKTKVGEATVTVISNTKQEDGSAELTLAVPSAQAGLISIVRLLDAEGKDVPDAMQQIDAVNTEDGTVQYLWPMKQQMTNGNLLLTQIQGAQKWEIPLELSTGLALESPGH